MKKTKQDEYPGPIRMSFRKLRLSVPIHWVDPETPTVSPCGSRYENDVTTDQYHEDVTCSGCRKALGIEESGKDK